MPKKGSFHCICWVVSIHLPEALRRIFLKKANQLKSKSLSSTYFLGIKTAYSSSWIWKLTVMQPKKVFLLTSYTGGLSELWCNTTLEGKDVIRRGLSFLFLHWRFRRRCRGQTANFLRLFSFMLRCHAPLLPESVFNGNEKAQYQRVLGEVGMWLLQRRPKCCPCCSPCCWGHSLSAGQLL